jgi:hypothetical protein
MEKRRGYFSSWIDLGDGVLLTFRPAFLVSLSPGGVWRNPFVKQRLRGVALRAFMICDA